MTLERKVLISLSDIAPEYIDEHLEWDNRRTALKKTLLKNLSVAACIMLVLTAVFTIIVKDFTSGPAVLPQESSPSNIQLGSETGPQIDKLDVIYAEDFNINSIGGEVVYHYKSGSVNYRGELHDLIFDDEKYEGNVFAVNISFSADLKNSDAYYELVSKAETLHKAMWKRYDNEFKNHKLGAHNSEVMSWSCDECLYYNSLHEQDTEEIDRLYREAEEVNQSDIAAHREYLRKYCKSYIETMGLEYSCVKVIWGNGYDDSDPIDTQEIVMLHLTKEQLKTFKAPNDVAVEFTLLPEWTDTGETVIYRDSDLYPVQCE